MLVIIDHVPPRIPPEYSDGPPNPSFALHASPSGYDPNSFADVEAFSDRPRNACIGVRLIRRESESFSRELVDWRWKPSALWSLSCTIDDHEASNIASMEKRTDFKLPAHICCRSRLVASI